MKQWLERLSLRERIMLASGAAAVLASALYAFTYLPIVEQHQRIGLGIDAQRQLKTYLQSISGDVAKLRQNAIEQPVIDSTESQMSIIDASSEQAGVKLFIKRLVPEGQNSVTLWLEKCDFDKLINWLALLAQQHGITVQQINLSRDQENVGQVSGKVLLGN
jgi:general secretion pathway protein M